MDRSLNGFSTTTKVDHRRAARTAKGQDFDTNPRSRKVNRSTRAADYVAFADDVRRDLNPCGPLERLMADHVVQSAWRLKTTLRLQADRDRAADPDATPDAPKRPALSAADRAARSVRDALESLDYLRSRPIVAASAPIAEIAPNEWPILPDDSFDEIPADPTPAVEEDDSRSWRDRLVYDFEVSDISPVVKGTWITVGHVVSLIVDGWTWTDILRAHPELTEDDIRTCLAYAVAEDNQPA